MRLFNKSFLPFVAAVGLLAATNAFAQQTITFDGVTVSGSSLPIDLDADTQPDLVISSPSSGSLTLTQFGANYGYASEPVLSHAVVNGPEFRLDFTNGLNGSFSVDFTTDWGCNPSDVGNVSVSGVAVTVELFATGNSTPLATQTKIAECVAPAGTSDFAEGRVTMTAAGADYAIINYNDASADISVLSIDNVSGALLPVSTANSVPVLPAPLFALLVLLTGFLGFRFHSKS